MATIEIRELRKTDSGEIFYPLTHADAVIGLTDSSFFEAVPDGNGGTSVKLKSEYTGLWAEGWGSFGGVGIGGGGGSSTSYLNDLLDVAAPSPSNGDLLLWDANHRDENNNLAPSWVNVPQSSITPDLSGYGHSLSLSNTATYLLDSNGNYLLDSHGNYLVTSVSSTSINLLNGSGSVISSITLPTQSIGDTLQGFVPVTRTINGHALSSDITLSATTDLGVAEWATGSAGSTVPFDRLPDLFVAKTQVASSASNAVLYGVSALSYNDSSVTSSNDDSRIAWEPGSNNAVGAWHANGHFYSDGWVVAGGIGAPGGSGDIMFLDDIEDVTAPSPSNRDFLYWNGSAWVNTPIKTINGEYLIGSGNIQIQSSGGTLSSVGLTMPTGFSVSGSPLTANGSITVNFASGYSLPTATKQGNWDTAYGWGDHSQAGYATVNSLKSKGSTTLPIYFNSSGAAQTITGLSVSGNIATSGGTLSVSGLSTLSGGLTLGGTYSGNSSNLVWDNNSDAWHLVGNLYVDGWFAAGGSGTSGGGGALSPASVSELGGIKVGAVLSTTPSINTVSSTAGKYYYVECDSNGLAFVNVPWVAGSSGGGTLTEVGLTMPNCFSVSNSPLTADGAITVDFASQTKNTVLAAPTSANGTPSFRALVAGDIPDLSSTYLTSHQSVTLATGTNSGTMKLTTAAGTTDNIAVKNCVTTDGTQTITGAKTFSTNPVTIGSDSGISVSGSSYIDIGNARIVYDSGAKALHIKNKTGVNDTISLFADGFVSAGGTAAQSTISFVTVGETQSVTGTKTFVAPLTVDISGLVVEPGDPTPSALTIVGKTTATGDVSVTGNISATTFGGGVSISSDEINYGSRLYIQYNSNDLCLTKNGKTIIGTYPGSSSIGSNKLYVDGSAIATAWNTTSDRRLKEDISGIDGRYAVETLMAFKPSTWTWNCGLAKGTTAAGFIAQDVENIVPYMVSGEDYKSLNYQMLHAFEVSAIQSHELRIKILEEENKKLKELLAS